MNQDVAVDQAQNLNDENEKPDVQLDVGKGDQSQQPNQQDYQAKI